MQRNASLGISYSREFYENQQSGSLRSARAIVPILVETFRVRSVVDIGCGVGTWLSVFAENGISDYVGYDGNYVDRTMLHIDAHKFMSADLRKFDIGRTFDLAISLEVAEHLPEECACEVVGRLTEAAPIVLFSAAIPGQGGINHVNEQWQDYWRKIFLSFDFVPVDLIRPVIWGRPDVAYWYQQNAMLYLRRDILAQYPDLRPVSSEVSLDIVHRTLYENSRRHDLYPSKILRLLPMLVWQSMQHRVRGFRGPTAAKGHRQSPG